jgi:hypothetical protein
MKFAWLCLGLVSFGSYAANHSDGSVSAYRPLRTDYTVFERRALGKAHGPKILRVTPLNTARAFAGMPPASVTHWRSLQELQKRFEGIRDKRFLTAASDDAEPRRISWLYPKDGCFARAALANRLAFHMYIPVPDKVFAFGNLRVDTDNTRRGVVGWWYHVAPIVQVSATKYVLDPAIEHARPLPLPEWLDRMGDPKKIKVAFCGSGTYSPGDDCRKETDGLEARALRAQRHYLALEERELERMGRDPERELGETPPWEIDAATR